MKNFFETTFGPTELGILKEVLDRWLTEHGFSREQAESELAAAILINLFREGSDTVPALREAANRHKALVDLVQAAA
jgi:hypothetical protein